MEALTIIMFIIALAIFTVCALKRKEPSGPLTVMSLVLTIAALALTMTDETFEGAQLSIFVIAEFAMVGQSALWLAKTTGDNWK